MPPALQLGEQRLGVDDRRRGRRSPAARRPSSGPGSRRPPGPGWLSVRGVDEDHDVGLGQQGGQFGERMHRTARRGARGARDARHPRASRRARAGPRWRRRSSRSPTMRTDLSASAGRNPARHSPLSWARTKSGMPRSEARIRARASSAVLASCTPARVAQLYARAQVTEARLRRGRCRRRASARPARSHARPAGAARPRAASCRARRRRRSRRGRRGSP